MPLAIDVDRTRGCTGAVYLEMVNAWFGPGSGVLVCAGCRRGGAFKPSSRVGRAGWGGLFALWTFRVFRASASQPPPRCGGGENGLLRMMPNPGFYLLGRVPKAG